MKEGNNPPGNVFVSYRAIASVVYQSALQSYGVVGLAAKNLAEGLANVLVKDPTMGVDVHFDGKSIQIDLYVIVEYGTRIKTVATTVSENVRYQVEKTFGLPVTQMNVHVRGLRISDTD